MVNIVLPVVLLLVSAAILLLGNGMLGTLLGLRAGVEGFPAQLTGVVMSAYFVGFVAGSMVCPALIARTGHIRAFAVLAALAAAVAPLYAYSTHPAAWMGLRFLSGVCVMGLYMVIESWLSAVATRGARGRVFGVYMAVNLLAMAAAQALLLVAPVTTPTPFVLAGVILTLSLIPIALTHLPEPARVPATPLAYAALSHLPRLGLITAFATGLTLGAFWGMGAVYGQRIGLDTRGVALFMAATILGGAALQWPIGRWSDRHERRRVLSATVWVGTATALLATGLSVLYPGAVAAVAVLYGGCAFALYSLGVATVTDAVPTDQIVDATRALLLVNGVGSALGPVAVGYTMGSARPGAFFAYSALVLGALALIATRAQSASDSVPVSEQGHFTPLARTSPAALEMHPEVQPAPAPAPEGG